MDWHFLLAFLSITLIDIVLAGDNAVVIALAARTLPQPERFKAIAIGSGLAVFLRVLMTFGVAQVLQVPFLSAAGGLLVAWIAVRLVREDPGSAPGMEKQAQGFWHAIWLIAVADFVMSTDNMIAIGGASRGSFALILFGLGLSIPIIMFCSALIARLMDRLPWLAYAGAAVLGWTGGVMVVDDRIIQEMLVPFGRARWIIPGFLAVAVILVGHGRRGKDSPGG